MRDKDLWTDHWFWIIVMVGLFFAAVDVGLLVGLWRQA